MTIEKVKYINNHLMNLYHAAMDESTINNVKQELKDLWNSIKNDEETLSVALKLENTDNINVNFVAPSIAGLVLVDYENVDALAYDVVRRWITENSLVATKLNPLFKDYNIIYLTTLLFNKNLKFTSNKINELNYISDKLKSGVESTYYTVPKSSLYYYRYYLYNHPEFFDCIIEDRSIKGLFKNYEERAKLRKLTKLPF